MGKFRILATFLCLSFFNLFSASNGRDIITPDQAMENGEALVSAGGTFKLGFFSPSGSTNRYLGIWYNNIPMQTVVWVANRNSPVTNFPAVLNLTADGNLALHDNTSNVIWLTNTSNVSDPTVQLLDSGNLVLTDNSRRLVWQSFDYPSDTFLPGMKLGFNQHLDWHLTSWTSPSDPSPGTYSSKIYGYREIGIWNLTILKYRSGPWNGHGFNGFTDMKSAEFFSFRFFINQEEEYYTFEIINKSILSRVVLNQFGVVQRSVLLDPIHGWKLYWWFPMDQCDEYAECGAFGVCNTNDSSVCKCLRGFVPKSPEDWALRDFSDGCVRRTALHCGRGGDGFLKVTGLKLPDTSNAMVDRNMSLDDCRDRCLKNCSCMAFNSFSEDGSACLTWHGDLLDIREFTEGGQDLYVRLASSELDTIQGNSSKKKSVIFIVIPILLGFPLLVFLGLFISKKKRKEGILGDSFPPKESRGRELELPLFDMSMIKSATDDFSFNNELGKGGFGPVYKGQLRDGQEIAVKRLSKDSVQGLDEFKNEVFLIAKLQHRNLVRLLGCCIQHEERMLIYEYMPNKSLDAFIFEKSKGELLSWQKRHDIIMGIARGLLYLHQDSRLKIIHRDLKASNILLDKDMNPKISDFGTARILKGDDNQENTRRVVGTYGYMSPEYVMHGIFSVKSDVFSFGVIILEILSGMKNRMVNQAQPCVNLLGYAWRL